MTRLLAVLVRWGLGLCALLLVLTALYVSLGRQLVPLVAEYRADVEQRGGQALGLPLHIGRLEGSWSGFRPVLTARDVMLGEGANVIRLDHVQVVPDLWRSLVDWQPRLAHLQLEGLQVSLLQQADGQWMIQGLPHTLDDEPFDPQKALERLRIVSRVSLMDSQVTLQPLDAKPLTLTYVDIGLASGPGRQRVDARATLPDGQPLALNLNARLRPDDWRNGEAGLYLSLPQSDWSKWIPPALIDGWHLQQFDAGGELWLDWGEGTVQRAAIRLNAPRFKGSVGERKAITLDDIAVNAWLQRSGDELDIRVGTLALTPLNKPRWETRLQINHRPPESDGVDTWHLQADRMDLTPLTPLLNALVPMPDGVRTTLNHLKVTGGLRNLMVDLRPGAELARKVSFAANLDSVGFEAYHGAPATGNVSGAISGNLGGGELRLDTRDFMLHLYPTFAKGWRFRSANAQLTWKVDEKGFTLIAPYIKTVRDQESIAADFLIRLHFDHTSEDYMDLRVGMQNGDGRDTGIYLPTVLSPDIDHWLRTAILGGRVEEGFFQYQGSLNHNAADVARNISLFFKVRDASLDFQPGWPQLTGVDGDVFVEGNGVRIRASKGRMLDTQVSSVKVDVPHAPPGQPSHLLVDGDFDGTLGNGVTILQSAPIGTGSTFAGWQGEGPLGGHLNMDIPLVKGQEPKVIVDFATGGARLKIADPALELSQLKGSFRFDYDKGLSGKDIAGQAFGQPLTAEIFAEGKPATPVTRIVANSRIASKRLTDWLEVTQPLPISGEIPYRLQVLLNGNDSQLSVSSSLKGLAIDLPAPFGKLADESRDSQFRMSLQGPERRFDALYGDLASLAYSAPAARFGDGRGELFLGAGGAVVPDARGLRVRGSLAELDVAPWQALASRYAGGDTEGNARQLLSSADLRIGKLTAMGNTLNDAGVRLARAGDGWGLSLDSAQAKGRATLPDAKSMPIGIDMDYLRLPAPDPSVVAAEDAPDPLADVDPSSIPALNLSIRQLFQGDQLLGAWSLKSRPTATGLRLSDLNLGLKGMTLKGDGGWEGVPGATSSWFRGRISGQKLEDVLKAWSFAPTVTSREFELNADGRWPGSPAWVGLKRFSGSLDAKLKNGQFVEVEGGAQALRVFGLLNFNSIGRRLRLDFSDLLGKGLSYDEVKGLLVSSDGVYVTRKPITLTGPSSNLELDGTLDMVRDRVDAKLLVTLPVTNNLPIAALIVGAPAVGGALFLVDKLLGDRVARFASVQYRVEGPWKEPKITFDKPFEKPR